MLSSIKKLNNQQRREFVLALIHDLRNPIIALDKMIEMILDLPDNTTLKDIKKILLESTKSNKDLLKMIDDFLSIYHCETANFEIILEKFNIDKLLKKTLNALRFPAKEKNIKFKLNIEQNLTPIRGGRIELQRVFVNLIGNAIKHGEKDSEIIMNLKENNGKIIFEITNFGEKITEKQKNILFSPYKTAKNKLGQGLGLYICKKIVEMHNGNIWMETDEKEKVTFYFSIPIQ